MTQPHLALACLICFKVYLVWFICNPIELCYSKSQNKNTEKNEIKEKKIKNKLFNLLKSFLSVTMKIPLK